MPFKNEEDRKAYMKKYEEIRREERRKQKRENWLKNHEHNLAVLAKRNKKKGFQKREPDGPHAKKRVRVPKVRRWVFIEDRVYFNREIGYERDDIMQMLKMWDGLDEEPVPRKKVARRAK